MTMLQMSQTHYDDVLRWVRRAYPREGCGFLAGRDGMVEHHLPVNNVAAQPDRFRMAPREQVDALLWVTRAELEVVAIYHSHPHGPAQPSALDGADLTFPDVLQLIISLRRHRPVARAFAWRDDRFVAVPFDVT